MAQIFEVYVKTHFSAAHCLTGYAGDCSRTHGHNWIVEVFVQCRKLDKIGISIDFRDVKTVVKEVLGRLDHTNLNDLEPFQDVNPTSENIARFLYQELSKEINSQVAKVSRVKVSETPGAGAFYWEE